jgi:hypothetical protein
MSYTALHEYFPDGRPLVQVSTGHQKFQEQACLRERTCKANLSNGNVMRGALDGCILPLLVAVSIAVSIAASGCRLVGLNTSVVYYSRIETNWQPGPSAVMIGSLYLPCIYRQPRSVRTPLFTKLHVSRGPAKPAPEPILSLPCASKGVKKFHQKIRKPCQNGPFHVI